ncbi:unnamed protein product [Prorocentrum cordatum]|uniref:Uncharacterized protein n=1 Tax=Prorocentrum cordatum TaxID=2364126 RepID=A0ABN9W574_9DINO|nr:unnamed protein product [Polarella glacialis]
MNDPGKALWRRLRAPGRGTCAVPAGCPGKALGRCLRPALEKGICEVPARPWPRPGPWPWPWLRGHTHGASSWFWKAFRPHAEPWKGARGCMTSRPTNVTMNVPTTLA